MDLTTIAERVEAEVTELLGAVTPDQARAALGMAVEHIGGGVVISLRDDPTGGHFNRVLGLGITEPVTARVVAGVLDFHRRQGSPACTFQIPPHLLPADWDDIVAAHGLIPGSTTVKFAGEVDAVKPASTDLRVGPVGDDEIDTWSALVWELFGVPGPDFPAVTAAAARTRNYQAFAAWDGAEMVAVAALYVNGEAGQLNSAATRETHRRRGVQAALIAARTAHAAGAGCRWVVSETGKPRTEGGNPSLNNMARAGLTPLYDRPEWVWRPDVQVR
ncbi:GNAT family N-acetyltransferase [Asanoa siamensis]|uniref:N-acetyltransferase domain-containing protein n=1 Tax=Asanoa siamensis TaxID=926357 RepID=A0ABQ4D127_9ACTN|nr:GNAT family N-acetyltransferase [Asanoa siamensis]GIF77211.1 hypothetical protein Asi02nite_67290 [Asanoa siamensis]